MLFLCYLPFPSVVACDDMSLCCNKRKHLDLTVKFIHGKDVIITKLEIVLIALVVRKHDGS